MTGLAWGGYANGRIDPAALHAAPNFTPLGGQYASTTYGSNLLEAEAACQLSGLMQAFYQRFRKRLLLREGYRSINPVQDWYYNRFVNRLPGWTLAAYPGTSNHGWGLSGDLGVETSPGANNDPSGEYLAWLRENAPLYGITNDVASETWHWTYRIARSIVVRTFISNPNTSTDTPAADAALPLKDALMTAADTLTYFQRIGPSGKDEDTYFVAGPGVFADVVINGKEQKLTKETGLTSKGLRTVLNREKVKAEKLPARDYDERRSFYASLAKA